MMDDKQPTSADEFLTGLYVQAEQTQLSHEPPYDVDAGPKPTASRNAITPPC